MPQSTRTQPVATRGLVAQATQEDASSLQHWEPGLKPSQTTEYSLTYGWRHTRALLPTRQPSVKPKLSLPAWNEPYGEALLATESQTLTQLLTTTEMAFFERILELRNENASDEREDMSCAIDVVLNLKI
jgi:hypothetical protein